MDESLPAVRLRGLKKSFGPHHVLRGVDLDIPRGQVTVVIGMSGAGKSVLLKLIMGLILPDEGSIEIDGQDITKLHDADRRKIRGRFGYVFQNGALFDSMTVFENVAFPLREHEKMTEDDLRRRVMSCLEAVGLETQGAKLPSNLSGGMRKRASLARALVRNPDFLLYDEPTTGLDPIRTASIDQLIATTNAQKHELTSLVISHDMHATFKIAHKVAMLMEGVIAAEGDPAAIMSATDPRVQQFIAGRLDGPIEV